MARRKEKTSEEKSRDRDKRLRKTYGISASDYTRILEFQNGKCAVCGRPASDFTISLNVDHQHFRIETFRSIRADSLHKWTAATTLKDGSFWVQFGKTKKDAIAHLKELVMPKTIRGLLCPGRHPPGCNRKMGMIDDPVWLRKVIAYLNDPPAKKVLTPASPTSRLS